MSGLASEIFVADGWRLKAAWAFTVLMPAAAAFYFLWFLSDPGWIGVLALGAGLAMLGSAWIWIWGVLHRGQPVVEVSDQRIEFGALFGFARRRSIATADVCAVQRSGPWLVLTTRDGGLEKIAVSELSPERAAQVMAAIERRIAGAQRPA